MEWSWSVWGASVGAVVLSAAVAWLEGNWMRRSGLSMGFANHGGMWGDLLLLPIANALVVPQLTLGSWLPIAFALSAVASVLVHVHWYRGHKSATGSAVEIPPEPTAGQLPFWARSARLGPLSGLLRGQDSRSRPHSGPMHTTEHMWPARRRGVWHRDLSWAGWLHVLYVAGELTLLAGFLTHAAPPLVVLIVCLVFTIHVPIGLLQPRWFVSGKLASLREQPLLVPCMSALWILSALKVGAGLPF